MKTFNSSEKSYRKQRALAYIVYMMAGSYFSLGSSNRRPSNLYLHYAEMPREKQYQYESRVISSMEALGKEFLQSIATLRCNVRCKFCGDDILLEFCTGGFEGLQCRIQKNCTFQLAPIGG
ncbi:hypothetical protein D3Z51_07910 [Clostridiaceae bacterium]|nr:hypothetical protein [Clostridiaceae bacterium]RKI15046.1 hypothetical protein D7V81_07400 [bacterium 1XD21-70]